MAGSLVHGHTGLQGWLRRELAAIWPVFVFFLVGFLLLISLIKLALTQFSIEVALISNAAIGALLAAKAALVLDETPLARSLGHYRGIVAITTKVFFYGLTSLLFLYAERVLEALHKFHNFDAAVGYVSAHATRYKTLDWALGIAIVFGLYFVFVEIDARMGEGELWKLFFASRKAGDASWPSSDVNAAKDRG